MLHERYSFTFFVHFSDFILVAFKYIHHWILQVVSEDGMKIKRQYSPTESDIEELQVIIYFKLVTAFRLFEIVY